MKFKISTLFIVLVLLISAKSFGQVSLSLKDGGGAEITDFTSVAIVDGQNLLYSITLEDPNTNQLRDVGAGTIGAEFGGVHKDFYCIDFHHPLGGNNHEYWDSGNTPAEITYVLNNYYPYNQNRSDALSVTKQEAAAVQTVVWHYSDGLDLNTITNETIKNRALAIKADADANKSTYSFVSALEIVPASQNLLNGQYAAFKVVAKDDLGQPMANVSVTVSTNSDGLLNGTPSQIQLTTGITGLTDVIFLTQGTVEDAVVSAEAIVVMPHGTRYVSSSATDEKQKLVLATPTNDLKRVETNISWEPVLGEIGNFVWNDLNNDGIQDADEPGIPNVTVNLYDEAGTLIRTTQTDENGFYLFNELILNCQTEPCAECDGKFSWLKVKFNGESTSNIRVVQRDGAEVFNGNVAPGEEFTFHGQDNQNTLGPEVTIYVNEVENTSIHTSCSQPLEVGYIFGDFTIVHGASRNGGELCTDANECCFSVSVEQNTIPEGFNPTQINKGNDRAVDSNENPFTVCLSPLNPIDHTVDFGYFTETKIYKIGDYVWHDSNVNGIQDADENGIAGVLVELYKDEILLDTTRTNADGLYLFEKLENDTYKIKLADSNFEEDGILYSSRKVKWHYTKKDQGTNNLVDSDANSDNPVVTVTLNNADDLSIDFGFYKTCVTLLKEADKTTAKVGDIISYSFTVSNCGDVELGGGVNVFDDMLKPGDQKLFYVSLNPGESKTLTSYEGFEFKYTVKEEDCGKQIINHAFAEGHPVDNSEFVFDEDDWTVTIADCIEKASLGDKVWLDENKDGIQNENEIGFEGVTVNLLDCNGVLLNTKTTDGNGNYLFSELTPGDYKVEFVLPADYKFTSQNLGNNDLTDSDAEVTSGQTTCITLEPGENNLSVDAGVYLNTASLGDFVWNDVNKDGIQNDTETGIAGITVNLFDCNEVLVSTTVTNGKGNYLFNNLIPGSYLVEFVIPAEYQISAINNGDNDLVDSDIDITTGKTICIELEAGEENLSVDAGVYLKTSSLGDYIWLDADKDGLQGTNETGVSHVLVELFNDENVKLSEQYTDGNGKYLFTNLLPDQYYILVTLPANYAFTLQNAGSNDAVDSDLNVTTGKSDVVDLGIEETNLTLDGGIYLDLGAIGDYVWLDENKDGIQDDNESGVEGVTVNLFDCSGVLLDSKTTDANGKYLFTELTPNDYKVKFVLPTYYEFTAKDSENDDLKDSDADLDNGETVCVTLAAGETNLSLDAGIFMNLGAIGDYVWLDEDEDGIQDDNENGVANITVKLADCDNDVIIATTQTDANGYYIFEGLVVGSYKVIFENPVGYTFTTRKNGNSEKDSDADITTGETECIVLGISERNLTLDAGIFSNLKEVDIKVVKTVDNTNPENGSNIVYTIEVTNLGPDNATGVKVSDLLPDGVSFVSTYASQGSYDDATGIWTVGSLINGASATLDITVTVEISTGNLGTFDIGPAKGFNVFVLNDINQPSADTEGRMAVGNNATLANYSVGDKLPNSNGTVDVLIVGNHLEYSTGRVYHGNVVYGNSSNLPKTSVSVDEGTIRKESIIDFAAAEALYLNMTKQLADLDPNGSVELKWGGIYLVGNDPFLNIFEVNGSDLTQANNVDIQVPNGSTVVINVLGDNIKWSGGLAVKGIESTNVAFNFPDAENITIQGIDVLGAILAPKATVNFIAGVQNGQIICKNIYGSGQFNNKLFIGDVPGNTTVVNVAKVIDVDQVETSSSNNSSSAVFELVWEYDGTTGNSGSDDSQSGGSDGNQSNTSWTNVGGFGINEIIWTMNETSNGLLLAGTMGGKLYLRDGDNWTVINSTMHVGFIWSIAVENNKIYVGTEQGVFVSIDNGANWESAGLEGKDVRALKFDKYGNLLAGTWGFGVYKLNGTTWSEFNSSIESKVIHSLVVDPATNDIYAGTFGFGILKLAAGTSEWITLDVGYQFIWALDITSDGTIVAGTFGGGVYLSTDNGVTWHQNNNGLVGLHVYSISILDDVVNVSTWTGGVQQLGGGSTQSLAKVVPGLESWNSIGMFDQEVSTIYAEKATGIIYAGTKDGQIYKVGNDDITDAETESTIPNKFSLDQNYPNPFNPSTMIQFAVPESGSYSIIVYNIIGKEVAVAASGNFGAGTHKINFDASLISTGVYIYRLVGNNVNIAKKMILMK
ncbi:MAG: choice-of-anchor A family protein [Melioribacteraceae bacterium]|nr:choice-of-anchor A family protein [Melioribacteraceae bacterium]